MDNTVWPPADFECFPRIFERSVLRGIVYRSVQMLGAVSMFHSVNPEEQLEVGFHGTTCRFVFQVRVCNDAASWNVPG